jgi:hypothetical protein
MLFMQALASLTTFTKRRELRVLTKEGKHFFQIQILKGAPFEII